MTESINCDLVRQDQRWMNTRRVREELVLRIQNGGLTTQHDTEKRCESFLIWPIFDRNFNLQMSKIFNISFIACKQALRIGLFQDLLSNGARSKARGRARQGEPAMVLVRFEYSRSDSERKLLIG